MNELRKAAYDWVCDQIKTGVDTISAVSSAAKASENFNLEVKANTLEV
jgi:hypothetical protein